MPAKKLRGMLMTRAQGQLMTRKVNARYSQVLHWGLSPRPATRTSGGSTARARALQHTAGV